MTISPTTTQKVIIGLSGGVDSAVSARRLLDAGYSVEALFMKNWNEDDGTEYCTARQDLEDALRICDHLDIELHTANFASEYWDNVFDHFLTEYRAGRTPNPDVLCNREIKFKVFLEHAQSLGADKIATGHYARLTTKNGQTQLLKGLDSNKDQSYFLHAVPQHQLAKSLFPLGEIEKRDVRALAEQLGLHVHNKKDSTGICFIGERRFKDFLETYLPAQPGTIFSIDGDRLGEHNGLMFHTIGQRQGLGIGGINGASDEPWYVAEKRIDSNELIVVQGNNHPALFKTELRAEQFNWINGAPARAFKCNAKTRYRQTDQACDVQLIDENCIEVNFATQQRAITPGQYIVLYDDDHCLGGGIII